MVNNYFIKCQVCGCITRVRLQVGWQESHPIVVSCGRCGTSLTGYVEIGQDTPGLRYHFDNADATDDEGHAEFIVECSGEFPVIKQRALDKNEPYILTPFIRANRLMGEKYDDFCNTVNRLTATEQRWTGYKRIINLYQNNSEYTKQEIQKVFKGEFFQCRDEYELARAVHMIDVNGFYSPLRNKLLDNVKLSSDILKLNHQQLDDFLGFLESHEGYHLDELQSLVYTIMDEFMSIYKALIPALATQYYDEQVDYKSVGSTTSTYETVKQFYLDVYEGLGTLLIVPLALDNILNRNDFKTLVSKEKNISSIDDFIGATKANRLHFIDSGEQHMDFIEAVCNSKLRNAIGHNDVEYNAVEQIITYIPNPRDRSKKLTEYLLEFEDEAIRMFQSVLVISEYLYRLRQLSLMKQGKKPIMVQQTPVKHKKIGRNEPCPCGSGKKYKYCCGRN